MGLSPNQDAISAGEGKRCAGLKCSNVGIYSVKIRFINKTGRFCSECIFDLIRHDLAEPDANPDNQDYGQ